MTKSEFNKLLELPVNERLALAKQLQESARHDEEVRFVPIDNQEVCLVRVFMEETAGSNELDF